MRLCRRRLAPVGSSGWLSLLLMASVSGHPPAAAKSSEVYRVTPAAQCVYPENLNGLLFLHNACEQEVRAYWCVERRDENDPAVATASCAAMAVAESKASVEIKPGQAASLAIPRLGGNLKPQQVRQVHVAVCPISTHDISVPHHFELSYTGRSVTTRCLEKTALRPGQRTRSVDLRAAPEQPLLQVRLLIEPQ